MDEVEIRDLEEDSSPGHPVLKNQDLSQLGLSAAQVLSQYGWYLLAASVTIYLLIQHLRRRRTSRTSSQDQKPLTQQEASLVARKQESMEAARRKMQEEMDAKVAIFKEKQRQQEEEKRQQKIQTWDNMKQGRSCRGATKASEEAAAASASAASSEVRKPKTDKKPLRSNDYNPLTGQGGSSSCSWRPGRRGPSAGG